MLPTLENDQLVFRFPQIEEQSRFAVDFQRTLRIPDTDRDYPLPPGFGRFPLRHVEDHAARLPAATAARGGVFLPMWQAEALWLCFTDYSFDLADDDYGSMTGPDFPVAIKIAAGKINAVTGEPWRPGLNRGPQDYVVAPDQPWLDGFAVEKGMVRQFVAMPLGEGYSAEEQITGEATWGGLQIAVTPLKVEVWRDAKRAWAKAEVERKARLAKMWRDAEAEAQAYFESTGIEYRSRLAVSDEMLADEMLALAPGGRMRQAIHPDRFRLEDWDLAATERVFATLVHARDWKGITGEAAPTEPPTAQEYAAAGLPWFEHYGRDQAALPGAAKLGALSSVASLFKQKTGATLPHAHDVPTPPPVPLGPGANVPRPVRTSDAW